MLDNGKEEPPRSTRDCFECRLTGTITPLAVAGFVIQQTRNQPVKLTKVVSQLVATGFVVMAVVRWNIKL